MDNSDSSNNIIDYEREQVIMDLEQQAPVKVATGEDLSVRHYLLAIFARTLNDFQSIKPVNLTKILYWSPKQLKRYLKIEKPYVPHQEIFLETLIDTFYQTLPDENVKVEGHFTHTLPFKQSLYARLLRQPQAVMDELKNLPYQDDDRDLLAANATMYLQECLACEKADSAHRERRLLDMNYAVVRWSPFDLRYSSLEHELSTKGIGYKRVDQFIKFMLSFFGRVKANACHLLSHKNKLLYNTEKPEQRTAAIEHEIERLKDMSADELYNWLYRESCQAAQVDPKTNFELSK